ncbi:MATE family efflux transporter [Fonticella tunisiensis]|uniref:Multidrug export protein MepA n=1 Tax=Fonticella tunisiensis TaxID=1096341 RepID=A0A4V3ES35_9CLOT|nr:MATE family efflux transporter [Fonticella tunisiensis]TDT51960.1 putative MATE family efflux protein [Fonticella tunisiensis]
MDRSKLLGEESIGRLLLKFSIPAITGMLVNALYNVVDRIFVGNGVGAIAITGITISFPIMNIIMAFGMLVGIGAASLVSIRLGQKKKNEAEQILGNALTLTIIISLTLTVLGIAFLDPILIKFGASGEALLYSRQYTSIIIYGIIFQNLAFSMNHSIRAEGSPKMAMITMLIGAVLNTILDYILVFIFKMGVQGAAIATIFSQAVSAAWVLSYFFGKRSTLKIHRANLSLRKDVILSIFSIGMSPFAMQLAASAITIILNSKLLAYGGDIAVAAMGVINSITMLILMPIFGINQGSQPIIGFNYGAQKYDRVKKALKLAIIGATAVSIMGFIVIQLFPQFLIGLFGKDSPELIEKGSHGIRIFLSMLPIIGFQIVSANYFQAVGKPKHSMFLSLSRQVIVLIPLLLILPNFFKLDGVWMAGPASDFISSILTGLFLFIEIRHLENRHKETKTELA